MRGVDPFPFLSDEQIATMTNIAKSMEARIPMWLHPNDKKDYHNNVYVGQKANAPAGSKRKRQDTRNLSPDAQQRMIDERVAIGIRAARDYEAAEASRRAEAEERAQQAEIDRKHDLVPRSQRNTVATDLTPEERQLIQERRRAESSALTSHVMSSVDPTWSEPVAQVRPKPSAQELNAKKRADAKAAEKAKPKKKNDDDDEVDFDESD